MENFRSVKLNLRGTVFITNAEKFKRFPDSRLARLTDIGNVFDKDKDEFFFDRNPSLFHFILDTYDNKEFHAPKNICSSTIQRELRFWKLNKEVIGKCCLKTYYQDDDEIEIYKEYEDALKYFKCTGNEKSSTSSTSSNSNHCISNGKRLRRRIWDMLVNPLSSNIAKVYFATTAISVLVSIMVFALSTLPTFRQPRENATQLSENISSPKVIMFMTTKQSKTLFTLDVTTNSIIAVDIVLGLYGSPSRLKTIDWYTVGDVFTSLTVYAYNVIDQTDSIIDFDTDVLRYVLLLLGVAYSFRILRILRLVFFTKAFLALYMTIASKSSAVFQFLIGLFFICLISACAMYHVELFGMDHFEDLFASMWWSVVTLSTVGYGDVVPETVIGKSVSVFLIMTGLVLIAIPFVLITNDYGNYCSCLEYLKRHEKHDCEKEKECAMDKA